MWVLKTVRRLLGQPEGCGMPYEALQAIEVMNQQADDTVAEIRKRREKGLLNGALAPARPNGRRRP